MAIKYFKKLSPRTAVQIGQHAVSFPTLDNIYGYYATENEGVQQALRGYIEQQIYGLSEIDEATFVAEYLSKKKSGMTSPRQYREELTRSGLSSGRTGTTLGDTRVAAAVVRDDKGASSPAPEQILTLSEPDAPASPLTAKVPANAQPTATVFNPTLGKRPA